MSGFRLWQQCCYGFYSSWTWRCVAKWSVLDVSRQRTGLHGPKTLGMFNPWRWNLYIGSKRWPSITLWRCVTSRNSRNNLLRYSFYNPSNICWKVGKLSKILITHFCPAFLLLFPTYVLISSPGTLCTWAEETDSDDSSGNRTPTPPFALSMKLS
jgi:hypothetical protein